MGINNDSPTVPGWLNYDELTEYLNTKLGRDRPIRKSYLVQIVSESKEREPGSARTTKPRYLDRPFPAGRRSGGAMMWSETQLPDILAWFEAQKPGVGGGVLKHRPGCTCGKHDAPAKPAKRTAQTKAKRTAPKKTAKAATPNATEAG